MHISTHMLLASTKHLQSPDSEDRLHTIKGRRGAQDWLEPKAAQGLASSVDPCFTLSEQQMLQYRRVRGDRTQSTEIRVGIIRKTTDQRKILSRYSISLLIFCLSTK